MNNQEEDRANFAEKLAFWSLVAAIGMGLLNAHLWTKLDSKPKAKITQTIECR